MIQANMLEAKKEPSKPAKLLESGQEDVVYIVRNNSPVAQMTLIDPSRETKRIGEYDTPCVLKV